MKILFLIILIFVIGYAAGVVVTRRLLDQEIVKTENRRCNTCNYCFEISQTTKSLMHPAYTDKLGCHMCRGSNVPVGYNGASISVVNDDAFCDQWKERVPDG